MNERWKRWAWPLGAAALAGLARWPSLGLYLDRDEGEFASLAWLWRSHQGLPYRDFLEQKPPLNLLPHVLAQALAPEQGVLALRWISLVWILATVLAFFAWMRGLASLGQLGRVLQARPAEALATAGAAALVAGLLFSGRGTQAVAANAETWQTLPLLGALALVFLARPRAGRWLAVGWVLGLASLFKQPLLAGVLVLPWAAGEKKLLSAVAWTGLGVALAWALASLPWILAGAGWDLLNCTLAYNRAYVIDGQAQALGRALGLAWHLAPELAPATLLALGGAWRLHRDGGRWGWLAAWAGLGLLTLAASGRYYPHYAIVLMGPLAALAGLGAQGLWRAALSLRRRAAVVAVLAGAGLAWGLTQAPLWSAAAGAQRTWVLYHVASFCTAPQAAERLQALCPADKRLFIWGDDAEIFYLSRRAPATRFLFTYPFTGEAPPWPHGDSELRAGLQDPRTGAAVVVRGLSPNEPLQVDLRQGLSSGYTELDTVPAWILGQRRP